MTKRIVLLVFAVSIAATPAFAQAPKAEVGVFAGWVYSDGVSGDNFRAGDGNIYNRVDPKDSFGWGIDIGVFVGPNAEVGFIYANQPTTLQISGTTHERRGRPVHSNLPRLLWLQLGRAWCWRASVLHVRPWRHELQRRLVHDGRRRGAQRSPGSLAFPPPSGPGVKMYGQRTRGRSSRAALDADLHQVGCGRLLVRSVLGLLSRGRRPVLEPVHPQRRRDRALLTPRTSPARTL